jgi:membrane protein YdbS with pleckstrin-like domain
MLPIFILLIAAFGWYYLFYSRASQYLGAIEDQRNNRIRGVLRRINALVMLIMAVGIALGTYKFDQRGTELQFLVTWAVVMFLLLVFIVLAMIDVRLTWKLRQRLREQKRS